MWREPGKPEIRRQTLEEWREPTTNGTRNEPETYGRNIGHQKRTRVTLVEGIPDTGPELNKLNDNQHYTLSDTYPLSILLRHALQCLFSGNK